MHGEVTDPDVDFFDREAVFIERHLAPLLDKVRVYVRNCRRPSRGMERACWAAQRSRASCGVQYHRAALAYLEVPVAGELLLRQGTGLFSPRGEQLQLLESLKPPSHHHTGAGPARGHGAHHDGRRRGLCALGAGRPPGRQHHAAAHPAQPQLAVSGAHAPLVVSRLQRCECCRISTATAAPKTVAQRVCRAGQLLD